MARQRGFPISVLTTVKSRKLFSRYLVTFCHQGQVKSYGFPWPHQGQKRSLSQTLLSSTDTKAREVKVISPSSTSLYVGRQNHSKAAWVHAEGDRKSGTDSRAAHGTARQAEHLQCDAHQQRARRKARPAVDVLLKKLRQ